MLRFSQQHKIINDLSLSFQQNKKIHTKISEKILTRDVQFLNPKKYETYTEGNFKFLSLWTVFRNNTGKIDTLRLVNSYDSDEIKDIMKEKQKIILYKNTIRDDFTFMKSKTKSTKIVLNLYQTGKISCLYVYWFFKQIKTDLSRIQTKQIQKIDFFMSFFPSIQNELNLIKL